MRPRDTGLPHPADGCPQCVASWGVVPYRVEQPQPEGVKCWYRCPRCLHSWSCSWGMHGEEWNDPHNYPDAHGQEACPCPCGLRLLRPARIINGPDYGTEVA